MEWSKGRGKLGVFKPLMGTWQAQADGEMGTVTCRRWFTSVLDGAYIQLSALWLWEGGRYEELALFGLRSDGRLGFWSFTSDKKNATGWLADVTDIHPQALGFEAQMPSGLARQAYFPAEEAGFIWVVESKTKRGWNRFVEHHYLPVPE